MIRICRYGEVPNEELFARRDPGFRVEERVREIIGEVVMGAGDEAVLASAKAEVEAILAAHPLYPELG